MINKFYSVYYKNWFCCYVKSFCKTN